MRALFLFFSLIIITTTSQARIVCGVEVGNEPTLIASNLCLIEPFTLEMAIKRYSKNNNRFKQCMENGKRLFVGIFTRERMITVYDFSTPATKVCASRVNLTEDELLETDPASLIGI